MGLNPKPCNPATNEGEMMHDLTDLNRQKSDLYPCWVVAGLVLLGLLAMLITPQLMGETLQHPLAEHPRILVRSVLYLMAILLLPITNMLRFIFIRLNQTMPGNEPSKKRYLRTVSVSMCLVACIGSFGFIMYILGDGKNTLFIFALMSALGVFLYRPKLSEYQAIIEARSTCV